MEFRTIKPGKSISLFVKNILLFEEEDKNQKTVLPFFADGYPGLMFHETENGLLVNPFDKQMPSLFLYGQTIKPIELVIQGAYKLIVFQLYPFVLKSFFNIDPKDLNDDCYDLEQSVDGVNITQKLHKCSDPLRRVEIITALLSDLFDIKRAALDFQIRQAIEIIINSNGQITIQEICKKIHLTERTFERRFLKEAGISPKQFSQITRFQQSLQQISLKEYSKLTDLVYNNGFADQSHFIRVFKTFTGKTPKKFSSG